jgi:hypothetical protein
MKGKHVLGKNSKVLCDVKEQKNYFEVVSIILYLLSVISPRCSNNPKHHIPRTVNFTIRPTKNSHKIRQDKKHQGYQSVWLTSTTSSGTKFLSLSGKGVCRTWVANWSIVYKIVSLIQKKNFIIFANFTFIGIVSFSTYFKSLVNVSKFLMTLYKWRISRQRSIRSVIFDCIVQGSVPKKSF